MFSHGLSRHFLVWFRRNYTVAKQIRRISSHQPTSNGQRSGWLREVLQCVDTTKDISAARTSTTNTEWDPFLTQFFFQQHHAILPPSSFLQKSALLCGLACGVYSLQCVREQKPNKLLCEWAMEINFCIRKWIHCPESFSASLFALIGLL